ncbi:hypothetical protein N9L76_10905 [bacterium]|nr:hypothetical protein [bacterium]
MLHLRDAPSGLSHVPSMGSSLIVGQRKCAFSGSNAFLRLALDDEINV